MKKISFSKSKGMDKKGGTMKRYLFGLGARLVGAGLMFVLMHEEVGGLK